MLADSMSYNCLLVTVVFGICLYLLTYDMSGKFCHYTLATLSLAAALQQLLLRSSFHSALFINRLLTPTTYSQQHVLWLEMRN